MLRALCACLLALSLLGPVLVVSSSSPALAADGVWTTLPIPSERDDHAAVFDPVRHRMLVFGGRQVGTDLWELSASGIWTQLPVTGSPAQYGMSAIYDPLRDRILAFGGVGGGNSVWQLPLAGPYVWSAVSTSGTPPSPRWGHTAVYDPSSDRMIVFGGSGYLNDVWQLSLSGTPTWSALTPQGTSPAGRMDHTAILDTQHGRMLVFGGAGFNSGSVLYNDVWALSLSGTPTWSLLATAGASPSPRAGHTAIYDPVNDRMIMYGGRDFPQPSYDDLYQLSLSGTPTWSRIPSPGSNGPWYRFSTTAVYDSDAQRMIVFGGYTFSETFGGMSFNDSFQLNLSGAPSWSSLSAMPPAIPHVAIYDGLRDRMLAVGGTVDPEGSGPFLGLWELTFSGSPQWNPITTTGDVPSPFFAAAAVYDPTADRMLLIGDSWNAQGNFDVWQLPLSGAATWSKIIPSGTPPPDRQGHTAIYDPTGNRVIVFGGQASAYDADTWALDLNGPPSWTQLFPANVPPPGRFGHSSIYDSARHRMVVFGGSNGSALSDVWELTLDGALAWNALTPSGVAPSARSAHTAIYDPVADRMVVFGGTNGSTASNDAWELGFSGGPQWNKLSPTGTLPDAMSGHTSVYDALRNRMIVWGGASNEVSFLSWGDLVGVPPGPTSAASRMVVSPNPFRSGIEIRYTIPVPSRASVRVFDVQGRERAVIAGGMHAAAAYDKSWDGRDRFGRSLPSGVYLIQLQTPDRTESIRVVHIE